MTRVSRRAQLVTFGLLALLFVAAFVLLRPQLAPLSDGEYVAIAKATPQGELYFKRHSSSCTVTRVWNVQVNCDYTAAPGTPTEKFRVYIDPRSSQVIDVEMDFNP